MQAVPAPQPSWMMIFFAIFAIGMFIRLVSAKRIGLICLFLLIGGVLLTFGYRQAELSPATVIYMEPPPVQLVAEVPPLPDKPGRPKRGPKPKPPGKPAPAAALPTETSPPEPPAAAIAETSEAATPSGEPEAPITLYHGWASTGRAIDSLPEWVQESEKPRPGSNWIAISSDRFATIDEAEKQLWNKAREVVVRDLRARFPEAVRWSPSNDLLKLHGLILERCVERTSIEVGQFVEPMYRVHWKAALSKNVREAVASAWRPTVQEQRLESTALGFLGATALLAFVNVILRLAPCPNAKKEPTATA
ncbi:hypothetical protein AYO47_02000 [Planctomyces sp. SCGC AG-212-M04]|nr:hypothetical protein AYO47_02000 [Planctomyces sp. SCGC AG-212-M04]